MGEIIDKWITPTAIELHTVAPETVRRLYLLERIY